MGGIERYLFQKPGLGTITVVRLVSQRYPNNNFNKRDLDQALNREQCAAGEALLSRGYGCGFDVAEWTPCNDPGQHGECLWSV